MQSNRIIAQKCEESPCIQGQTAGESPDGASRWKSATEMQTADGCKNITGDGATVR